jgi:hypothetical protein
VWFSAGLVIRDSIILGCDNQPIDEEHARAIAGEWSSGALHAHHPGPKLKNPIIGNHVEGADIDELWNARVRGAGERRAGIATLVHLAREHAAKEGIVVPENLCRPRPVEQVYGGFTRQADAQPADGAPKPPKPSRLLCGSAMLQRLYDKPPEIVAGVVGVGTNTVISSDKGTGKSALVASPSHAVITKRDWMGFKTRKALVCALVGEGIDRTIQDFAANCIHHDDDVVEVMDRGFAVHEGALKLNTDDGLKVALAMLDEFKERYGQYPDILTVDTVRKNMTGSVSDDKDVDKFFEALAVIQERAPGISTIIIAHTAKSSTSPSTKGSSDWEQGADYVIHLSGKVRDKKTKVTFEKVKTGPDGHAFEVGYKFVEVPGAEQSPVPFRTAASSARAEAGFTSLNENAANDDATPDNEYADLIKCILNVETQAGRVERGATIAEVAKAATILGIKKGMSPSTLQRDFKAGTEFEAINGGIRWFVTVKERSGARRFVCLYTIGQMDDWGEAVEEGPPDMEEPAPPHRDDLNFNPIQGTAHASSAGPDFTVDAGGNATRPTDTGPAHEPEVQRTSARRRRAD